MRRKKRNKIPLVRLMLVVVIASLLFGAGFYAYYKRTIVHGADMQVTLKQWQAWLIQRQQQVRATLGKSSNDSADEKLPEEKVKFEFYHSLAETSVSVDESGAANHEKSKPVVKAVEHASEKVVQAKPAPRKKTVDPDKFATEFYRQNISKGKAS